eukprot:6372068-Ditylum_brightwellii.AAC.1
MCPLTMCDPDMIGILPKANKEWRNRHDGSKLFGTAYANDIPSILEQELYCCQVHLGFCTAHSLVLE